MPGIGAPIIAALIGAATTAVTTGLTLANEPSTPKIPTTAPPLTAAQNQNQTAAVANTLPTLQSLTGGSLSPEYAAQYGANQTGLGNNPQSTGNIQAAINQYFGLSAPGQGGLTPSTVGSGGGTNILDLLARAVPGAGPGGIPVPGSNDEFKGLVS